METDPEQLRHMGELVIDELLGDALAALRHQAQVSSRPVIDADTLHAVEIAVGHRFANDLLATWAAAIPCLASEREFLLGRVVAHTGALAVAGAPGDLIGLGREGEEYLCLEKRRATADHTLLSRFRPGTRSATRFCPLVEWISALVPPADGVPALEPYAPRLERTPPTGSSGQRVRHKSFGVGRVYVEIGTGPERKVKVDFPGVGLKFVAARFLEYLDD
jgi:hypothetical protein